MKKIKEGLTIIWGNLLKLFLTATQYIVQKICNLYKVTASENTRKTLVEIFKKFKNFLNLKILKEIRIITIRHGWSHRFYCIGGTIFLTALLSGIIVLCIFRNPNAFNIALIVMALSACLCGAGMLIEAYKTSVKVWQHPIGCLLITVLAIICTQIAVIFSRFEISLWMERNNLNIYQIPLETWSGTSTVLTILLTPFVWLMVGGILFGAIPILIMLLTYLFGALVFVVVHIRMLLKPLESLFEFLKKVLHKPFNLILKYLRFSLGFKKPHKRRKNKTWSLIFFMTSRLLGAYVCGWLFMTLFSYSIKIIEMGNFHNQTITSLIVLFDSNIKDKKTFFKKVDDQTIITFTPESIAIDIAPNLYWPAWKISTQQDKSKNATPIAPLKTSSGKVP